MENKQLITFSNPLRIHHDLEFIQQLELPRYPTKMQTSKAQRAVYYRFKNNKWKPRKLPKTYKSKLNKKIYNVDKKGYLTDENNERVLANPRSVGKPNYEYFNGNKFTTGMHYAVRKKMVDSLQKYYRRYVPLLKPMDDFPIRVFWIIKTVTKKEFDLSNMWFYYKYFEDCLFETNSQYPQILPDDNWKYVSQPGTAPLLYPVKNWEDRAFIFQFYKDNRKIIKDNYEH